MTKSTLLSGKAFVVSRASASKISLFLRFGIFYYILFGQWILCYFVEISGGYPQIAF